MQDSPNKLPQRTHGSTPSFPRTRLRRNRYTPWIREMLQEFRFEPSNLIWPIFVTEGTGHRERITTMPGVERVSVDLAAEAAKRAVELGIGAIAIFPVTPQGLKTEDGKEALNPTNLICRATHAIAYATQGEIGIVCDVALDPYTSHGQDGLLIDGYVANDQTVEILCEQAINQAKAGATVIAPSDMMDGRIGAIRDALDREQFSHIAIMAYTAKYASAFYGPFRDAVGSGKNLASGDKKTYQMNPANSDEAIREAALDVEEGADILMVKPGMPYLDIIRRLHDQFPVPIAAYQVSGEYAMLKFAAQANALDERSVVLESLLAFRRAGATAILSYFAMEAAEWLNQN